MLFFVIWTPKSDIFHRELNYIAKIKIFRADLLIVKLIVEFMIVKI